MQSPASVKVITVRVVFSVLVVLTLGLLAWTAMLRLAIVRRTRRDWALFWAQLTVNLGCLSMLHTHFKDTWVSNVGMAVLLLQGLAVVVYYLIADIHFHQRSLPVLPPHPPLPPSPRIHQVRAELDELSSLLRQEEGR
ncbi:hypothetical protein [Streptomyces sp. CBMA152]|uniref:hypothetical protein n=1 Tax=Streptomyces sp. CBMA152 TaxID=1896312 RepID=UPI0016613959|nr:hypothetical protein [Streptomyces sp. CBMA152]MBD0746521.1 hypothetical protein [Streptomyces sp. CBMA152]